MYVDWFWTDRGIAKEHTDTCQSACTYVVRYALARPCTQAGRSHNVVLLPFVFVRRNLAGNQITQLPAGVFDGLTSLQQL